MSFHCSGKKAGQVDMTFKLNYTGVLSGTVDTEDVKSLTLVIRRECLKTSMCSVFVKWPSSWQQAASCNTHCFLALFTFLSLVLCFSWPNK